MADASSLERDLAQENNKARPSLKWRERTRSFPATGFSDGVNGARRITTSRRSQKPPTCTETRWRPVLQLDGRQAEAKDAQAKRWSKSPTRKKSNKRSAPRAHTVDPAAHGVINDGIGSNQHLRFISGSRFCPPQLNIHIHYNVRTKLKTLFPE